MEKMWNRGNLKFSKCRATKVSVFRIITVDTFTEGKVKSNLGEILKGYEMSV